MDDLPFVGEALLAALRARFPDTALRSGKVTLERAHEQAGEQAVIDYLTELHETQNQKA